MRDLDDLEVKYKSLNGRDHLEFRYASKLRLELVSNEEGEAVNMTLNLSPYRKSPSLGEA